LICGVIVRRQDQEHCASITRMIRHYVARRAQVTEGHPHNAADRAGPLVQSAAHLRATGDCVRRTETLPPAVLRLHDRVQLDHLVLDTGHVGLDVLVEPRLELSPALPDLADALLTALHWLPPCHVRARWLTLGWTSAGAV
jgi:hypothetical protein